MSQPSTKSQVAEGSEPTITVSTIVSIVGATSEPFEIGCLESADRRARAFLKADHAGVLISDESHHYKTINALARDIDPDLDTKIKKPIDLFDAIIRRHYDSAPDEKHPGWPSDMAGDRLALISRSAYYFGLCVGLRLAGGVR